MAQSSLMDCDKESTKSSFSSHNRFVSKLTSIILFYGFLLCLQFPIVTQSQAHNGHGHPHSNAERIDQDAALVVCGVDGTVYTLNAWTGALRGLFASGPALVSSSTLGTDDDDDDIDDDVDEDDGEAHCEDEHYNYADHEREDDDFHLQLNDPSIPHQKHSKFKKSYQNHQQQPKRREEIVPGLDGNLYTLTYEDSEDAETTDDNNDMHQKDTKKRKNTQLNILPVNVMDVTESPVSTCTNIQSDEDMECGIVMGEKKSTVFALDVSTGRVAWMQRPSSSEMGFTSTLRQDSGITFSTSSNNNKANHKQSRKRKNGTVLLQREDYFVRKIDTETGEEWWNVTVSHFSALDFLTPFQQSSSDEVVSSTITTSQNQNSGYKRPASTAATRKVKSMQLGNSGSSRSGSEATPTQFKRLTLTGQISSEKGQDTSTNTKSAIHFDIENDTQKDNILSRSFGKRKKNREEMMDITSQDLLSSTNEFILSFPSIAFGEDGTSITAVDSSTGEFLWTRSIDSIVAAVYGVGKENRWVSVGVVDESDIIQEQEFEEEYHTNIQRLMSRFREKVKGDSKFRALATTSISNNNKMIATSNHESSIVPFSYKRKQETEVVPIKGIAREKELAWVAKHAATRFVKSTMHRKSSQNSPQQIDYNALKTSYPAIDVNSIYSDAESRFESNIAVSQPVYQRKDGLFLSWRDILCIILFIVGAAAGVRTRYLQQKEKWINTPVITSIPFEMKDKAYSEHSDIPPLSLPKGSQIASGPGALARSVSLPHLKTSNDSRSNMNDDISSSALFDKSVGHRKLKIDRLSIDEEFNNARATNVEELPNDKNNDENNVKYSSIDGLPLVRYTRYDSEFKELSALGKGGFGTVFKCINALDSREYAIKKIKIKSYIDLSGEPSKHLSAKLKRVLREVKILALLDHANIVRYYTAWLEIEKEKESEDQFCDVDDMGTTTGLRDGGLFSSEASNSGKSFTISKLNPNSSFRVNSRYQRGQKRNLIGNARNNPLHLSEFDEESKVSESFSNDGDSKMNLLRSSSADLGFHWERSASGDMKENMSFDEGNEHSNNTDTSDTIKMVTHIHDSIIENDGNENSSESESDSESDSDSSGDESESKFCLGKISMNTNDHMNGKITSAPGEDEKPDQKEKKFVKIQKHILYIQMQLCSQKTLADFLASPIARKHGDVSASSSSECVDPDDSRIDITFAIRIFSQIALGVKHVHGQGLIHRDLKPSNCFVDDTGVVKVGDFGLSRTATSSTEEDVVDPFAYKKESLMGDEHNNTAGIGTRSYASPEQMNGSDYDASTDVYSLGIILFELCYPMYTGMERYLVFKDVRKRIFPKQWHDTVAQSHPSLHALMNKMLSDVPSERPTADEVAHNIEALLAEYTVQSLDRSQKREGSLLLRVEADDIEGILPKTVKIIKDASPKVEIVQYGLRGQRSKAIMEFALALPATEQLENGTRKKENVKPDSDIINDIFCALRSSSEIKLVRRVMEKHLGRGDSNESSHIK